MTYEVSPKADYRGRSTGARAAFVSVTLAVAAAGAFLIFGRVPSWAGRNSGASTKLELNRAWTGKLDTGEWHAPSLDPSRLYSLSASIDAASLRADSRYWIGLHTTHRIFRLAEPPASGAQLGDPAMEMNYRSRLRVIDVYEPESSLVLRKPLSPSGQGDEDASSPTGLTHVGGTRWIGRNDPAYQAILLWVRAATATTKASNSR